MVMFLGAPFIADFYKQPLLTNVTRIACLTIPIGALCSVHSNLLYCQLRFRDIAIGNILATFFSGGIGLLLAYNGYGVWALVCQGYCVFGKLLLFMENFLLETIVDVFYQLF